MTLVWEAYDLSGIKHSLAAFWQWGGEEVGQ